MAPSTIHIRTIPSSAYGLKTSIHREFVDPGWQGVSPVPNAFAESLGIGLDVSRAGIYTFTRVLGTPFTPHHLPQKLCAPRRPWRKRRRGDYLVAKSINPLKGSIQTTTTKLDCVLGKSCHGNLGCFSHAQLRVQMSWRTQLPCGGELAKYFRPIYRSRK